MRAGMDPNGSILIKCLFRTLGLQGNLFLFDWKLAWHMGCVYTVCVCMFMCFSC